MLPTSGQILLSQVNAELGKNLNSSISLNDSEVRILANKSSGTIYMSDLHGKRHRPQDHLIGWATTELQQSSTWDSGIIECSWFNISRSLNIRNYIYTATAGSDRGGNGGYAYIKVTIYDLNSKLLYDNVWLDSWTSGDGAGQLRSWNREVSISSLVGTGDNVKITIKKRLILGDYRAHIWGGRHHINRLCGIKSWVG